MSWEEVTGHVEVHGAKHDFEATADWDALDSGATSTTITLTCKNDSGHTAKITNAEILQQDTTAATCDTAGSTTYVASGAYDYETYTDYKTVTIPASGHSYGDPTWTWSEDFSSATATFTCQNDSDHTVEKPADVTSKKTKDATCTAEGETTYTATVSNLDTNAGYGKTSYTDEKTEENIEKIAHTYGAPTWEWIPPTGDGDYTAKAKFACTVCENGDEVVATVTEDENARVEATETTDGKRVIKASVTGPDGKKYESDPYEITIPKTGDTDDNTGDNTGNNTGDNTGNNTGNNTGDNTGGNTGDNTSGNTGENTGGNTGDGTGGTSDDATTVTVPITDGEGGVSVSVKTENGEAVVSEIAAEDLKGVKADETLSLDLTGGAAGSEEITSVSFEKTTLENVEQSAAGDLEIKLPAVTAIIDKTTLAALTTQASGVSVQLVILKDTAAQNSMTAAQKQAIQKMNKPIVLDASFLSAGKVISDFRGGKVTMEIPFLSEKNVRAWYVQPGGGVERIGVKHDGKIARISVSHFSHYALEEYEPAANALTVKGKTVKVKAAKVKKAKQTIKASKALTVSKAQGKVTYKKVSGKAAFKVNAKNGNITIKKGLKKGTYKIKIKVSAAGNEDYLAGAKTVQVKVRVK